MPKNHSRAYSRGLLEGNSYSPSHLSERSGDVGLPSRNFMWSSSDEENSSKRRAHEVVVANMSFLATPIQSDPNGIPNSHFPNMKVVVLLDRSNLENKYLLPLNYSFLFP